MTDVTVALTVPTPIVVQVGDVSAISILYAGTLAASFTAGETLAYGDICYMKAADGKLWKAQADGTAAEAEARYICIVAAGIAVDVAGLFARAGWVSGLSGGTAGSRAWLSATAGGSTTTTPTANYSKLIGSWETATLLYFHPDWASRKLS